MKAKYFFSQVKKWPFFGEKHHFCDANVREMIKNIVFLRIYFTSYPYKDQLKLQFKEYYHKAELQKTAQYKSLIELE